MGNITTLFVPEEPQPLIKNHSYPEIFIDSGYITKSQLILQFNTHTVHSYHSYSIHNYFSKQKNNKLFDAIPTKSVDDGDNQIIISDINNHIVCILNRDKWDTVSIQNKDKKCIASIIAYYDHFELHLSEDDMDLLVYKLEGDFEHNHFIIKNIDEKVVCKVSSIYGNQEMDNNFGVRICKNMDIMIVIAMCMGINMFTHDIQEFDHNMPLITPMGMPYV